MKLFFLLKYFVAVLKICKFSSIQSSNFLVVNQSFNWEGVLTESIKEIIKWLNQWNIFTAEMRKFWNFN